MLKKGDHLLSFRSVGLFQIPVFLIEESQASLKQRWLEDSERSRIQASKQLIDRLSSVILPLLKRRQEVQLDLRESSKVNNLGLIHDYDEISSLNCKILDGQKKLFANKLLLLNFIRKGFGIDRHTLSIMQKSWPKSLRLIEECEKKTEVQKKNYKFILHEGILFRRYMQFSFMMQMR